MFEMAVHNLLTDMRDVMVVWFAIMLIAVLLFVSVSAPRRDRSPRGRASRVTRPRAKHVARAAEAEEARRYAAEIAVAADRAAVTAQHRRVDWLAAQRTKEAAFRAYEEADIEARRMVQAMAFPTKEVPLSQSELEFRRRHLNRVATAAYRQGELSAEQWVDILFRRNGWDPTLHPFEQDTMLRRAKRDRLLRAYREASVIEDNVRHAADVATAAKQSLDEEAFAAAQRARLAQRRLDGATTSWHGVRPRQHRWFQLGVSARAPRPVAVAGYAIQDANTVVIKMPRGMGGMAVRAAPGSAR